ncbi:MAG: LysR family transcriptional regulator [Arthrobacter sp.]|jgi:DNA-binding transcriptional LysR family regulator|nr:LysR family transcriptional regulator [Arthrobacter sp.]
MNPRRLALFLAVVDHGTVTAAAEAVRLAQPALSRQLKSLQAELKIKLFEPSGQRLVLTPGGRAFIPIARRLVQQEIEAVRAVEVLRSGGVRRLACVATGASIRGFIARYIAAAGRSIPLITTRAAGHYALEPELDRGADFIVTPVAPSGRLEQELIGVVGVRACVPARHAWEGRDEIGVAELAGQTLLVPPPHTVSRQLVDQVLATYDVVPADIIECEDGATIQALAAAGHGIGMSTEHREYGTWACELTTPDGAPMPTMGLWMAWLRGHYAEDLLREIAAGMRPFAAHRSYRPGLT